jgi:hypothetical protein
MSDFYADEFDAEADMWAEEQEFNDMMEDLFYEDEEEIDRKLAEFGLGDIDIGDDDWDDDWEDEDDDDW